MTCTLSRLSSAICKSNIHKRSNGCTAKYVIPDKLVEGMNSALNKDEDVEDLDDEGIDKIVEAENFID